MREFGVYKTELFLLFVSFLVVVLSFICSIYDHENFWFMRSGSIMVLLAAIVEYRLAKKSAKSLNRKINVAIKQQANMKFSDSKEHNLIVLIAHIFIILGTIIWGYGDFLNK